MKKDNVSQYTLGRIFLGRLARGKDIIHAIKEFCKQNNITMATFSVSGAVSLFTIGTFDQKQQVYVTSRKENPMEITGCNGNILYNNEWHVQAQIILSDQSGNTTGGHLFTETLLYSGEFQLMELLGPVAGRKYDFDSGRMLWVNHLEKT